MGALVDAFEELADLAGQFVKGGAFCGMIGFAIKGYLTNIFSKIPATDRIHWDKLRVVSSSFSVFLF